MSQIDGFYVRGAEGDVPVVERALDSIGYDRSAIQVAVEYDEMVPNWPIAVDIETFRDVNAGIIVATFRDALRKTGIDTIDTAAADELLPTLSRSAS